MVPRIHQNTSGHVQIYRDDSGNSPEFHHANENQRTILHPQGHSTDGNFRNNAKFDGEL